jgi:hypothetical protein
MTAMDPTRVDFSGKELRIEPRLADAPRVYWVSGYERLVGNIRIERYELVSETEANRVNGNLEYVQRYRRYNAEGNSHGICTYTYNRRKYRHYMAMKMHDGVLHGPALSAETDGGPVESTVLYRYIDGEIVETYSADDQPEPIVKGLPSRDWPKSFRELIVWWM